MNFFSMAHHHLRILLNISLFFLAPLSYSQTATIDLSDEHQNISGFGGANVPDWGVNLNTDQTDKVFGNAPGQIGLTMLRIKIPNNEAMFERELPTAVRAKNNGAIIIASPWSPPVSMKSNNSIVGGYLKPESYGEFADYLLNFAGFMETNGAPLYALSVQNEPDVSVTYESCDYSPSQMLNFVKEQGAKFDKVKLIAAESFNFNRSITDPILNDAEAEPLVDIIGGHIYGNGLFDYPLARNKGKEVWMTEHFTDSDYSGNRWPLALDVGKEIHACMQANFNAYLWWYIVRFYGLIDDAGNITKRGYVFSQYAKFVRPGYTRVEVTTSGVSNVGITSYKTDTSLVIVAVNSNADAVDINFVLQNGSADSLTSYITSGTKNVEAGEVYLPAGGKFSVSLEAQSITTLSSFAGNAGRIGNQAPVADAGPDLTTTDEDNNGSETVTLDGRGSEDADGNIANYSWSMNDEQIAWGESPDIEFPTGTHEVILTVTDNDGARDMDTILVKVELSSTTNEALLWFEAECSEVGTNWNINDGVNASRNLYTMVIPGLQNIASPSENAVDHLVIEFEITEPGNYILWGRVWAPTADDDSFWIRMDNGQWVLWNNFYGGNSWKWTRVYDSNNGAEVVAYNLTAGNHTLTICYREDGTGIDKLFLTNTGNVPTELGGDAENCGPVDGIENKVNNFTSFRLFPNPADNELLIELEGINPEESEFSIYNYMGTLVETMKPGSGSMVIDISFLPEGMYFLKLTAENKVSVLRRFMKM